MTKVVSQDELDVLLAPEGTPGKDVARYDFRRPDRITKEQLRSLHFLHDRFAQNIATSISAFLRATTEVSIVSVDQVSYSEFLMSLPDPTVFYAMTMRPLDALMAAELNPVIALAMIHRMLGGSGDAEHIDRPLTEIEQNIVDSVVKMLMEHLTDSWRATGNVQFGIHARETRPQMLQVTGRNEIVVVILFLMKIGETRGTLKLCIPASAIEAVGDSFSQSHNRAAKVPSGDETARLAANLGRVPLAVTAHLSTTLSARELVALRAGDVLTLGRHTGQPVTVSIGSLAAYVGHLTVQNGSLAIRVQGNVPEPGEGPLA
jgi:flagellar motor switch protein FliM